MLLEEQRDLVLRGRLSNPDFKDLLQSLTSRKPRKVAASRQKTAPGRTDGRRKFGIVSAAIVSVLAQTDAEMRLKTIHAEVERLLDGRVSFYSVADYLHTRSKGPKPLFIRPRRGH